MSKKFYIDKGAELTDYYCPSDCRWLTNVGYIDLDGSALESSAIMIQDCWKFYGGVSVGPAFGSNGTVMHDMIAIYVKKVIPGWHVSGKICSNCEGHFAHEDVVNVEEHYNEEICLCRNCFHVYSYKEVIRDGNIVLKRRYMYGYDPRYGDGV